VVVDSVRIIELDSLRGSFFCDRFKSDINNYLASPGSNAPVKSLEEIIRSRRFHPSIELRLREFQDFTTPEEDRTCLQAAANAQLLQAGIRRVLQDQRLDALIYPTWNNPPRRIGDLASPHGNNSARLSPPTGFPAITVPMGSVPAPVPAPGPRAARSSEALPVGLQIFGDAWSEPVLIEIAFAYEQLTRHRRAPLLFPELR
jgi:Asp-tRNA(Asn)/Glu-tRNA(Gln) amidotransferase A subunit family amidase